MSYQPPRILVGNPSFLTHVPPGRTLSQNEGPETTQKLTPSWEDLGLPAIWQSSSGFSHLPALHLSQ